MNEEEQVRHLLEEAGPRPEVPPEDLAKIKAAFRVEWERRVHRRRANSYLPWAIAASVLLALGLGWWLWPAVSSRTGDIVARVEGTSGKGEGEAYLSGTGIVTGEEPLALRLENGQSLRLDADTRVRLVSSSAIELRRGAVYLDSRGNGTVAVHTPLGVVTEIGTQFEVRLLESAVRVRVREGAVLVESHRVEAGTELTLRSDGSLDRQKVASYGPPWSWVLKAAPPLVIEGLTLEQFLNRVGRETGWQIRYADPETAESAGAILVHGDLGDLSPDQAPDVVLPGAGLDHQLLDGTLVVRAPN